MRRGGGTRSPPPACRMGSATKVRVAPAHLSAELGWSHTLCPQLLPSTASPYHRTCSRHPPHPHALPAGVNGSVGLDLRGVSSAYVQPSQPGVAITGTAQGINAVHYTDGSCSISSAFPLLQVEIPSELAMCALCAGSEFLPINLTPEAPASTQNCQSALFVPIPVPDPVWSCGLVVAGPFACSDRASLVCMAACLLPPLHATLLTTGALSPH